MAWTQDRVRTLTTLWTDGHSASQIAKELGGVTRNAVIGKIHRLGLTGRKQPAKPGSARVKNTKKLGVKKRTHKRKSQKRNPSSQQKQKTEATPPSKKTIGEQLLIRVIRKLRINEGIKSGELLTLEQLKIGDRKCRYPVATAQDETDAIETHYCSKKTVDGSHSMCPRHTSVSTQSSASHMYQAGRKRSSSGILGIT